MALADITVNDAESTPVAHTFTYVGTQNGRVVRQELGAPTEEPQFLITAHDESKSGGVVKRGHLRRIDITQLDADGVTPHTASFYVRAVIPNPIMSEQLCKNGRAELFNSLAEADFVALCKGSVG